MSPELAGVAWAWLAHVTWYVSVPRGAVVFFPPAARVPRVTRALAVVAVAVSVSFWIAAHGSVLGPLCALATIMAAASFDIVAGPLFPPIVLGGGTLAACGVIFSLVELIRGG